LQPKNDNKIKAHILMVILVFSWGLEYVFAKHALTALDPVTLVFFKYIPGSLVILAMKLIKDRDFRVRLKDIPVFAAAALLGEILYFTCEYSAMDYLPVSLITILLAFVPVVSVLTERLIYKKRPNRKMIISMCICIIGVILILGLDIKAILSGRIAGYLFCFGAIACWNGYNYITARMGGKYSDISLTFNQMICTLILSAPYAAAHWPTAAQLTPSVLIGVAYLGFISAGIGFYLLVYGLTHLGPTTSAVYSNFLPVTATLFGWLFLGENITPMQMFGGAVIILSGYIVIKEKGKLEEQYNDREAQPDHAH